MVRQRQRPRHRNIGDITVKSYGMALETWDRHVTSYAITVRNIGTSKPYKAIRFPIFDLLLMRDGRYTVWVKKITPYDFCQFLPNGWEFLIEILHTYYAFKYTIHCQWFLALDEFCEMPEAWHPTHDSQVDWDPVNWVAIRSLQWSRCSLPSTSPASDGPCEQERHPAEIQILSN